MRNLLFQGDSLTAGYALLHPSAESVPALIQKRIEEEGLDFMVYNGGPSGSTSSNGLHRLDAWLRRSVDAFVLQLGINDLIRNVPIKRTRKNIQSILARVLARNMNSKIALMGMRLPENTRSPRAGMFNQMYSDLPEKYHLTYVLFFS